MAFRADFPGHCRLFFQEGPGLTLSLKEKVTPVRRLRMQMTQADGAMNPEFSFQPDPCLAS